MDICNHQKNGQHDIVAHCARARLRSLGQLERAGRSWAAWPAVLAIGTLQLIRHVLIFQRIHSIGPDSNSREPESFT